MTTAQVRGALHLPLNHLVLRRGGLLKAVLLRANALAEADPERPVVIEVLGFQPRLAEDVADFVRRGFLDPRVHVRSVLASIAPGSAGPSAADPVAGCVHVQQTDGPAAHPADPRSVVLAAPPRRRLPTVRRRHRADDGRLRSVDVLDLTGRRLRRTEYGTGDRARRVLYYRPGEAQPTLHRWLAADGSCYLAIWQAPHDAFWGAAFAWLDDTLVALSSPQELYRAAFEHLLRGEQDPVLFSEFRDQSANLPGLGFDPVVTAIRHPTLRRVAVVHSNHAAPGERTVPLRSSANFTALLESLPQWDLLVTATERQRADIAAQYGHPERTRAIAHFAPDPPPAASPPPVDPDRFLLVARIHRKKRVDEALQVFRLVLDARPAARLEVYGFGYGDELEAQILALVDELGLSEHVRFHGFVDDPSGIYAGACATLQTSESEGFGMAVLESLAAGVPVVAYDVMYGAREAIRDGVDGYVVPWGDRAAMAARLVALAGDPELRARLGGAAPAGAQRFSRERYRREWQQAVTGLPTRADPSPPADAHVADGALRLQFAPYLAGTAVLRPRAGGDDVRAPLEAGAATVPLPDVAVGAIVDVVVELDGKPHRARPGAGTSADPAWTVYATSNGYLSLRRRDPTLAAASSSTGRAIGTPGGRTASLPRGVRRRLRRLLGRR